MGNNCCAGTDNEETDRSAARRGDVRGAMRNPITQEVGQVNRVPPGIHESPATVYRESSIEVLRLDITAVGQSPPSPSDSVVLSPVLLRSGSLNLRGSLTLTPEDSAILLRSASLNLRNRQREMNQIAMVPIRRNPTQESLEEYEPDEHANV